MRCLGIEPEEAYRCDNGYTFHAEEGFLVLLMRMASAVYICMNICI